jgi:hypothetical protein
VRDKIAIIQQLVPMPDRWEFHYLYKNSGGDKPELVRVPMLGLALVEYPYGDDKEQRVVYFGPGIEPVPEQITLYADSCTDGVHPFFWQDSQTRYLGIAPADSPDHFKGRTEDSEQQLEAEQLFHEKQRSLYLRIMKALASSSIPDYISDGFDNFFFCTAKTPCWAGVKSDWDKVFAAVAEIETKGIRAVIDTLREASRLSISQICDRMKAA